MSLRSIMTSEWEMGCWNEIKWEMKWENEIWEMKWEMKWDAIDYGQFSRFAYTHNHREPAEGSQNEQAPSCPRIRSVGLTNGSDRVKHLLVGGAWVRSRFWTCLLWRILFIVFSIFDRIFYILSSRIRDYAYIFTGEVGHTIRGSGPVKMTLEQFWCELLTSQQRKTNFSWISSLLLFFFFRMLVQS